MKKSLPSTTAIMKAAVFLCLLLVGCDTSSQDSRQAPSRLDHETPSTAVFRIRIGMTEEVVRALLEPHTIDSGSVYWGGSGAKRIYFQIPPNEQVWVEIAGAPDSTVTGIGQIEKKQAWKKHGGDSITIDREVQIGAD